MTRSSTIQAKLSVTIGLALGLSIVSPKAHALWCVTQATTGAGVQCDPWVFATPVCAPEVAEGNLKATDRVLREITQEREFASTTRFKAAVARTAKLSAEERMAAYLKFVGVNPSSNEEMVDFIGAREPKAKHLQALERNLDLSTHQADIVAKRLTEALRGGLQ